MAWVVTTAIKAGPNPREDPPSKAAEAATRAGLPTISRPEALPRRKGTWPSRSPTPLLSAVTKISSSSRALPASRPASPSALTKISSSSSPAPPASSPVKRLPWASTRSPSTAAKASASWTSRQLVRCLRPPGGYGIFKAQVNQQAAVPFRLQTQLFIHPALPSTPAVNGLTYMVFQTAWNKVMNLPIRPRSQDRKGPQGPRNGVFMTEPFESFNLFFTAIAVIIMDQGGDQLAQLLVNFLKLLLDEAAVSPHGWLMGAHYAVRALWEYLSTGNEDYLRTIHLPLRTAAQAGVSRSVWCFRCGKDGMQGLLLPRPVPQLQPERVHLRTGRPQGRSAPGLLPR